MRDTSSQLDRLWSTVEKKLDPAGQESSFSETPTYTDVDFKTLKAEVESFIPNSGVALQLLLATATSGTRKNRVMLWLLLVGAPSSGKTELVLLVKKANSIITLDSLTLNSFISGERTDSSSKKVFDLLPNLDEKCLVIKDWTVIFSCDERATKKIIGDLVGAYDKSLEKYSSQRGKISYDSEFSHVGCITPATLNKHHSYLNMIGPRFLMFSMPDLTVDQEEQSFTAIFQGENRSEKEKKTRLLVEGYLWKINQKDINTIKPLTRPVQDYLKLASRFVSCARGIVIIQSSSFKNKEGETVSYYEPFDIQIEKPWRAVQQLIILSQYLALVVEANEIGQNQLEIVKEVVLSSMPADRAQALRVLKKLGGGPVTVNQMADNYDKSNSSSRRLLDELSFLGIVNKSRGDNNTAATYSIANKFRNFVMLSPREFLESETNTGEEDISHASF